MSSFRFEIKIDRAPEPNLQSPSCQASYVSDVSHSMIPIQYHIYSRPTEDAMSDVSTVTVTDTGSPNAKWLSQSLDRLHSPRKIHSELSKAYKQASSFFLTRRFPEALSAIEPVVRSRAGDSDHEPYQRQIAPIAKAEKKWRIKIWSFYLTLLNSIADLGLESGGAAFGRQCWRDLEAKIKHGGLWDEVVEIGYHGNEANLDAEVVVNLYDKARGISNEG